MPKMEVEQFVILKFTVDEVKGLIDQGSNADRAFMNELKTNLAKLTGIEQSQEKQQEAHQVIPGMPDISQSA
jgi:hypothetical protein